MTDSPKEITSTVSLVTLYEDRAEVQRQIVVPAKTTHVLVPNLSPCLDERSIEVLPEDGDRRQFRRRHARRDLPGLHSDSPMTGGTRN